MDLNRLFKKLIFGYHYLVSYISYYERRGFLMKKVWSILIAMVLVISVMGCGKAKEVAPVAPEAATTTEEAAPAADTAAVTPAAEVK